MPVTNADGDRYYVRLESEESWDKSLDAACEHPSFRTIYAKAWDEARKFVSTVVKRYKKIYS